MSDNFDPDIVYEGYAKFSCEWLVASCELVHVRLLAYVISNTIGLPQEEMQERFTRAAFCFCLPGD